MLYHSCDRLLWVLQGDLPRFSRCADPAVNPVECGEPLTVDTLQLWRPQLFAALKIATRNRFDNDINVLLARKCVATQGYSGI